MKLVVNIKLKPSQEQANSLKATLEKANVACNHISELAWETKTFGQYALHMRTYYEIKAKFGLTAQVVVRCIAKVADAYKLDSRAQRYFRKHSAQPYDERIIRFTKEDIVDIWTVAGRLKIPFVMGDCQRRLFAYRRGEVDLMRVNSKFYLACVCDIDNPDLIKTRDVLGVDFGIVNIVAEGDE